MAFEINHTYPKEKALSMVKKAISGKFAIIKDNGFTLKAGAPTAPATIEITDTKVTVSGTLLSKFFVDSIGNEIKMYFEENQNSTPDNVNSSSSGTAVNTTVNVAVKPTGKSTQEYFDLQEKGITLLKSYKDLFDNGIISEEEFNAKKIELLSFMNDTKPSVNNQVVVEKKEIAPVVESSIEVVEEPCTNNEIVNEDPLTCVEEVKPMVNNEVATKEEYVVPVVESSIEVVEEPCTSNEIIKEESLTCVEEAKPMVNNEVATKEDYVAPTIESTAKVVEESCGGNENANSTTVVNVVNTPRKEKIKKHILMSLLWFLPAFNMFNLLIWFFCIKTGIFYIEVDWIMLVGVVAYIVSFCFSLKHKEIKVTKIISLILMLLTAWYPIISFWLLIIW